MVPTQARKFTWTEHTFRCRQCGRRCHAAAEVLADFRREFDVQGQTDAQLAASIDHCNACLGEPVEGEEVVQ